jgi:ArsR family transcriptional regulator, arsenate/arsenite/antimonite-responsive transcriptional repressor
MSIMRTLDLIKALADLTRARMLHLLMQRGPELCVCDLVAVLELPQSTVSRQLTLLRYLGLVRDRRAGVWMYYSVLPPDSPAHELALELVRKGFEDEPVFAEDLERFDQLNARGKVTACCPDRKAAKPRLRSVR